MHDVTFLSKSHVDFVEVSHEGSDDDNDEVVLENNVKMTTILL